MSDTSAPGRSLLAPLLEEATRRSASDLHIIVGLPPILRIDGEIIPLQHEALSETDTKTLVYSTLTQSQMAHFEEDWRLCFSRYYPDIGHFRITIYYHKGNVEAAIRVCPPAVRNLSELGVPDVVADMIRKPDGLVLVTGPTGQGKTTTLNAMVDLINRERRCKIIMVEDPVEYRQTHRKSIVVQQEIGSDAKSFQDALVHILRQDPDVIGIGEMRDLETISIALTAAETGHLVLATLHTPDAAGTIDRIVDVYPAEQQPQIIAQLAATLEAVISQQLIPRVDQPGRVLATEILIGTLAVRNVIRDRKTHLLYNIIQTSADVGMRLMDDSLKDLYQAGIITYEQAMMRARNPEYIRGGYDEPQPESVERRPPSARRNSHPR
jgi:twitching motility protein PilT